MLPITGTLSLLSSAVTQPQTVTPPNVLNQSGAAITPASVGVASTGAPNLLALDTLSTIQQAEQELLGGTDSSNQNNTTAVVSAASNASQQQQSTAAYEAATLLSKTNPTANITPVVDITS